MKGKERKLKEITCYVFSFRLGLDQGLLEVCLMFSFTTKGKFPSTNPYANPSPKHSLRFFPFSLRVRKQTRIRSIMAFLPFPFFSQIPNTLYIAES